MCTTVAVLKGRRFSGWHGLLVVIVAATLLRLCCLGSRSFYGDEVFSMQIAGQKTIPELVQYAETAERHPPLPHIISRCMYLAGADSEFEWRLFGACCGVVLAGVVFLAPLACCSPRVGLLAGLLAATSPMGILFSQTNRWYPLAAALLAVAILGMVVGERRGSLAGWGMAAVALALAFYTVYLAAAVAFILMLMALVYLLRARRRLTGWMLAAVITVLAISPWVKFLLPMLSAGKIQLDPVRTSVPGLGKAALLLQNLSIGPTVLPWNWAVTVPGVVLFVALTYSFLRSDVAEVRRFKAFVVGLLVLSLPVMLMVRAASGPRYWLILLLPWQILVAGGLLSLRSRVSRMTAGIVLAVVVGYGLFNLYTVRQYQYLELADDWRGLARAAKETQRPGDEVWTLASPFAYYYGPEALYILDWGWQDGALTRRLARQAPRRVLLQYSPLSGWEGTPFIRIGEEMGRELAAAGFKRSDIRRYARDPDFEKKRKYIRGRDFPEYRHVVEFWVRGSG